MYTICALCGRVKSSEPCSVCGSTDMNEVSKRDIRLLRGIRKHPARSLPNHPGWVPIHEVWGRKEEDARRFYDWGLVERTLLPILKPIGASLLSVRLTGPGVKLLRRADEAKPGDK